MAEGGGPSGADVTAPTRSGAGPAAGDADGPAGAAEAPAGDADAPAGGAGGASDVAAAVARGLPGITTTRAPTFTSVERSATSSLVKLIQPAATKDPMVVDCLVAPLR